MTVGREHYTLHALLSEYIQQGVSKRIPRTAIPDGLVNLVSKFFIAHPDAILRITAEGKTLQDLVSALVELEVLTQVQAIKMEDLGVSYWADDALEPYDFVPSDMLAVAVAFSALPFGEHARLEQELGIEYCMGIVGFSYVTGIEYITKQDEEGLPEDLKHLEGYVTPVKVIRDTEDEDDS
jgi:hypothetical protein